MLAKKARLIANDFCVVIKIKSNMLYLMQSASEALQKLIRANKLAIPAKDISEPRFHRGQGGQVERIFLAMINLLQAIELNDPSEGRWRQVAARPVIHGEGEDDFVFQLIPRRIFRTCILKI